MPQFWKEMWPCMQMFLMLEYGINGRRERRKTKN